MQRLPNLHIFLIAFSILSHCTLFVRPRTSCGFIFVWEFSFACGKMRQVFAWLHTVRTVCNTHTAAWLIRLVFVSRWMSLHAFCVGTSNEMIWNQATCLVHGQLRKVSAKFTCISDRRGQAGRRASRAGGAWGTTDCWLLARGVISRSATGQATARPGQPASQPAQLTHWALPGPPLPALPVRCVRPEFALHTAHCIAPTAQPQTPLASPRLFAVPPPRHTPSLGLTFTRTIDSPTRL